MTRSHINISENYKDLCEKVTSEILAISNKKLLTQKMFTIVLSGGSTPKGVYQCMCSPSYREKFQWEKLHFFWSDERWVLPDSPKSNFRMVSEALLTKVKIPFANIHPIPTKDGNIESSARRYEETIIDFFKLKDGDFPHFDLILLGLGPDGHTASLFPGNPALLVKDRLVIETSQPGIAEQRITLTLPLINQADEIFFVVSGPEKNDIVRQVLDDENKKNFPARQIEPSHGKLSWYLDKAASGSSPKTPKRIGLAADHGGYLLKEELTKLLHQASYDVVDFGDRQLNCDDDYPDFIVPLARAVSNNEVDRGIAICGSGVGACIVANKVAGVRACLIHEKFSARQGVEDDDMNMICLGSKVLKMETAWELVTIFLASRFSGAERHSRRLAKVAALENKINK